MHKSDEVFMRLAIAEAKRSQASGGVPVGAVMVRGGKVIAVGHSEVWPRRDPSAHSETECIRAACSALGSLDLSDCTLYSTLEPCSMCLGCAAWAGAGRVVFGAFLEDVKGNDYEMTEYAAIGHAKRLRSPGGKSISVVGGVLRKECAELLAGYRNWARAGSGSK